VAGCVNRLDSKRPGLDRLPRLHGPGRTGNELPLERMDEDGHAWVGLQNRVQLDHVIVMVMSEQHVGQLELTAAQILEQRGDRTARVDHDRVPSELVRYHIGVRKPRIAH
jgi:hypothetical protein